MGSSEWHYTPSKIYPLLLARRPLVGVYHERSTVTDVLRRVGKPPSVRLVTYSDTQRAESHASTIGEALAAAVEQPCWRTEDVVHDTLACVFDRVMQRRAA
jgi:hypothetical protein